MSSTRTTEPGDLEGASDDAMAAARDRVHALSWIRKALADVDRAIETGHATTAKELLRRVQRVLEMPDIQFEHGDD